MQIPAARKLHYSRSELLDLHHFSRIILAQDPTNLFPALKHFALFRFRGNRGGRRKIPLISTHQLVGVLNQSHVNNSNLITISRSPLVRSAASMKTIDFCLLNARSINNISHIIKDFVVECNLEILALMGTWTGSDITNQRMINEICPSGYLFQYVTP